MLIVWGYFAGEDLDQNLEGFIDDDVEEEAGEDDADKDKQEESELEEDLEEDDFELIKDNLGIDIKKKVSCQSIQRLFVLCYQQVPVSMLWLCLKFSSLWFLV